MSRNITLYKRDLSASCGIRSRNICDKPFAHLFMVSLVLATTAWMAATKLAVAPVFMYALVFVLVEIAYIAFERATLSRANDSGAEAVNKTGVEPPPIAVDRSAQAPR